MGVQTIEVGGMSCGHCVARVRDSLASLEDVRVESVEIGKVVVSLPSGSPGRDAVLAAIRSVGYTAQ